MKTTPPTLVLARLVRVEKARRVRARDRELGDVDEVVCREGDGRVSAL
jgi:hypothetical protein